MRRLNFSKIKSQTINFVKSFAKIFKKRYSELKVKLEENKSPSGSYSLRKGGYKHYTHMLIPINAKFAIIFRNFNKSKLTGAMHIDGSKIYRIEKNPYYLVG